MPTEFVRVRDKNKTESSLPVRRAKQLAGRGDVEILDGQPATNTFGQPLPASSQDENRAADDGQDDATESATVSTPAKRAAGNKSKEQAR
ncbi:hypothetical protein ACIBJE_02065 [Micromonospora sp. NPDC050187]|uniref:hypothetical protein n=1 Tax=Micromonospora sp. NPDC050187 TaxID=3364277 RepID=UPI00378B9DF1